ncbi:hypothetical protein D3C87_1868160 [compost metagenome]
MVCPEPARVGADPVAEPLRGVERDGVLADLESAVGRLQVAPQAMQVDGVRHHRVVDQHKAHALAVAQHDGLGVRKLHAVERPHVAFHVARQMQFDLARWRALVVGFAQ